MRFQFDYTDHKEKNTKNKNLVLLEVLLNFNFLEKFYGWGLVSFFIAIRNNNPRKKTVTAKRLYDYFAKIETDGIFEDNHSYNIHDFQEGLQIVKQTVQLADKIELKENDFDAAKLLKDIEGFISTCPVSTEELINLSKQIRTMEDALPVKTVNGYLDASHKFPLPKKAVLIGARSCVQMKNAIPGPYLHVYTEIFSNLLRNENIATPYYKEIYISIGKTVDEAKQKTPVAYRDWHKYTYAGLDIEKYTAATEQEKEKMIVKSMFEGLRLIADVDHLDKEKIEKLIRQVEAEGMNIILTYKTEENDHYKVEVIYKVLADHNEPVPFYMKLTEKKTGKSNTVLINKFKLWWAPYSFGKITIKKNEIIIKGKGGIRGELSRTSDKLPEEHKFVIADVLTVQPNSSW